MATSRRTTASLLAAIALASLALTGCAAESASTPGDAATSSPSPKGDAGSGQSTEEACGVLKEGLTSTMTELQSGLAGLEADPAAAAAAIDSLTGAFSDTAAGIGNAEVRTVADGAAEAFTAFSVKIKAYAEDPANPDTAGLETAATGVKDAMTELGEVCP